MEFVITKFNYSSKFLTDEEFSAGEDKDLITLDGAFLSYDSQKSETRDAISKVGGASGAPDIYQRIHIRHDLNGAIEKEILNATTEYHGAYKPNMRVEYQRSEKKLEVIGSLYLSKASFNKVKELIKVMPNSNSYSSLEFIVLNDEIKNRLPLQVTFWGECMGIDMRMPIQQQKN
jgi:hypothetical protein